MLKDPVCGMELKKAGVAAAISHSGVVYSFCSETCAAQFTANPQSFVGEGTLPVLDSVCGMRFRLADTLFHFEYAGKTYHFCSEECYQRFRLNPESYTHPSDVI
jgi:P-type Cu+ transporter